HSLLRDPPFAKLHLISCRNLLIYLERELQDQVAGLFRYALLDGKYLFLGLSETADEELFKPVDKKNRIFAARARAAGARIVLPEILSAPGIAPSRPPRGTPATERATAASIHGETLEAIGPPSIVIDDRWSVVHVSASAARFFQQSAGPLAR